MDILNLIQNVGFPMACVCVCGWYIFKLNQDYRSDIKNLTAQKDKALMDLQVSLNNNTIALSELCTLIENGDGKHAAGD